MSAGGRGGWGRVLRLVFAAAAVGAGLAVHRLYTTVQRELVEQGELALQQQREKAEGQIAAEVERRRRGAMRALAALHAEGLTRALQRWDAADLAVAGTFQWDPAKGFSPDSARMPDGWAAEELAALWDGAVAAAEAERAGVATKVVRMLDNPEFPAAELGYQTENLEMLTYAGKRAAPLAGWAAKRGAVAPWVIWYRAGPEAPVRGCFVDTGTIVSRLAAEFFDKRVAQIELVPVSEASGASANVGVAPVPALPGYGLTGKLGEVFAQKQAAARLAAVVAAGLMGVFLVGGAMLTVQARREIRDAERKATFVTQVSHELRTPLTSIRVFADMLAAPEVTAEKRVKFAGTIGRESARLGALIDRLLTFNALERGKAAVVVEPVDVGAVVRETVEEMEAALQLVGLRMEAELPAGVTVASTDRGALKQALLNLLDNAAKYARAGGEVKVAVTRGSDVRVRVADRGPGVERRLGARVFEPFVQGGQTLTDKSPGVGLGLSIARGLLRAAGGDLVLLPSEAGAVFEIRMPAAAAGRPAAEHS